jgi:hypothetical protein
MFSEATLVKLGIMLGVGLAIKRPLFLVLEEMVSLKIIYLRLKIIKTRYHQMISYAISCTLAVEIFANINTGNYSDLGSAYETPYGFNRQSEDSRNYLCVT